MYFLHISKTSLNESFCNILLCFLVLQRLNIFILTFFKFQCNVKHQGRPSSFCFLCRSPCLVYRLCRIPCEQQSSWLTWEARKGYRYQHRYSRCIFQHFGRGFYGSCDLCRDPYGKFNEESLRRGWKTRKIGAALRGLCWWWKREIMTLKKKQWHKKKVKREEEPLVRLRPLQGIRTRVQRSLGLWLKQR